MTSRQRVVALSLSLSHSGAVSTDNIHVLGCGIVSWKPPANTGGEMPGYAVRFFDGDTYETSSYREIQHYFDDPERRWAVAANLSTARPIYVDVCFLLSICTYICFVAWQSTNV